MSGIEKQAEHWLKSSREDLRVAELLLKARKVRHGLFFLHLAMEKLLKAAVCRATQQPAPRIHSLPILAQRAGVALKTEQVQFIARFDRFNIAARYPDDIVPIPNARQVLKLAQEFREVYQCLAAQL